MGATKTQASIHIDAGLEPRVMDGTVLLERSVTATRISVWDGPSARKLAAALMVAADWADEDARKAVTA